MPDTLVQLTCEQCKKRKVKCDKLSPCSSCRTSGFICKPVQRSRLPRGRTGKIKKRNISLEDKVLRLEQLLEAVEKQVYDDGAPVDQGTSSSEHVSNHTRRVHTANKVENLVARDFWIALSNEVSGLRETLEASDGEDESLETLLAQDLAEDKAVQAQPTAFLFGTTPHGGTHTNLVVTAAMRERLLELYRIRVDPIFKILHKTDLELSVQEDLQQSSSAQALSHAIFFLAVCSTTQKDCDTLELGERSQLIGHYRSRTERSLNAAKLLTTTDLAALQAFVLYLTCLRCCMQAHEAWTLMPLAIRIADTCGIKDYVASRTNPFEVEKYRRLWFGIGLLDSQTAFSRGSLPLLSHEDLKAPPRDINDDEMSIMGVASASANSFTDMTFSYLCYHAMICQRKLCDPRISSWEDRSDLVAGFEISVNRIFGKFEFSTIPMERYTAAGAKDMSATMNLLLRRPPYKQEDFVVPDSEDFDLIGTACRALQSGLFKQTHAEFEPFRWFAWPKWYILAVLLVELLDFQPTPSYEWAYEVAAQSYSQHAQSASEATSSILWKPLARLMRRVDELRSVAGPCQSYNSNLEHADGSFQATHRDKGHQSASISMSLMGANLPDRTVDCPANEVAWSRWYSFLDQLSDTWEPL